MIILPSTVFCAVDVVTICPNHSLSVDLTFVGGPRISRACNHRASGLQLLEESFVFPGADRTKGSPECLPALGFGSASHSTMSV